MAPHRRRLWQATTFWVVALVLVGCWRGPGLLADLWPPQPVLEDFFQEWASARFYFDGLPVYTPQAEAVEPYLGIKREDAPPFNALNAHPPTSVLLALPFAALPYSTARLVWELLSLTSLIVSLAMIARQLQWPFAPWMLLPMLTLLLLCEPLREQNHFAQYNLLLLSLVVGGWAAARSERPWLAGLLLGSAAMIKLFPAFLMLPFLVRGRWRVVAAATLAAIAWTGLTLVVLGPGCYRDYVEQILPHLGRYDSHLGNVSLTALWHKLFLLAQKLGLLATAEHASTLQLGIAATRVAVVALVAWLAARPRSEFDRVFALAVVAMLLLSPLTWVHAFLLLLLPAALIWKALPATGVWRPAFLLCMALLYLPHGVLWRMAFAAVGLDRWESQLGFPCHTAAAVILNQGALLGLFALGVGLSWRSGVVDGCVTDCGSGRRKAGRRTLNSARPLALRDAGHEGDRGVQVVGDAGGFVQR